MPSILVPDIFVCVRVFVFVCVSESVYLSTHSWVRPA